MKIKAIRITNFRSIERAFIEPSDFNVFVGQNNHGKTNLFEAIEWLYEGPKAKQSQGDLVFMRTADKEMFVEIEFAGAQEGASKMKNEGNRTKVLQVLNGADCVKVRRSTKGDPKKRTLEVGGNCWKSHRPVSMQR